MGKKALVVVDMQKDFLDEGRKAMFSYDTETLVGAVNGAIEKYRGEGYDIIYIRQVYQNIITNKWIIGFALRGTPGADVYSGVNIVSDMMFEKYFPDTFSSKAFRNCMKDYDEVVLCGVDECGCVGATAKGAIKAGLKTYMLGDCIGCRFPVAKRIKMRDSLQKLGVSYI